MIKALVILILAGALLLWWRQQDTPVQLTSRTTSFTHATPAPEAAPAVVTCDSAWTTSFGAPGPVRMDHMGVYHPVRAQGELCHPPREERR